MEITLIQPFWYSETIANLVNIAKKARKENKKAPIVLLGGLLNAKPAIRELQNLNIKIIDIPYVGLYDYVRTFPKNTVVLTSPYGADRELIKLLKKRHLKHYICTSPNVKRKEAFIKKRKCGKKVIYITNVNTYEETYLSLATNHKFVLYDLSKPLEYNTNIFDEKYNKDKTFVIYQSELAGNEMKKVIDHVQEVLPKATILHEISDENYNRNHYLDEHVSNGDFVVIVSDNEENAKSIFSYYHLEEKTLYFTVIDSVNMAMKLPTIETNRLFIVSDGTVDYVNVCEVYRYFKNLYVAETENKDTIVQK